MIKDTITFKFSREALHTDGARIVGNAFYDLAAALFEWGGERNLDENGKPACDVHGHHTAQRISEYAVSLWEGKPHPMQADLERIRGEIDGLRAYLTWSTSSEDSTLFEAAKVVSNLSAQDREVVAEWVKKMREHLSCENARLTEALRVAEAEKADAVQARDHAVMCYNVAVRPDLAGPAALDDELPEIELRTPEMRIRSLHLRTAFWTLATLAQAHKGAVNHLAFTMSLGGVPKDAPPEMHQLEGWSLEVAAIRPGGKGPSRMLAETRDEIAELRATLDNERGEGDPPKGGWKPFRAYNGGRHAPGWRSGDLVVTRFDHLSWSAYTVDGDQYEPMLDANGNLVCASTARATMVLAAQIAHLGDDGGPMV